MSENEITKCIKCEKEIKFRHLGLTKVSGKPDQKNLNKLKKGELLDDTYIGVEIYRRMGLCTELAYFKWDAILCERCLIELIKNKIIVDKKD
jgi:hypothetical protein